MKKIRLNNRGRLFAGASVATLCAVTSTAVPAWAQENEETPQSSSPETLQLDTITVWATKVQSDSLYLGEQEIQLRQADHLSDLLRGFPGIDIGGTHSVNTRINFRGLDDRNLNIYIDGALQTNYLFHHIGNLLINPDILKSADLQLGTNTVTHGGLGGAARFETKDAAELLEYSDRNFGARIAGSYNTNAQYGGSFTGYGQIFDRLDALVYYDYVDRDNFEDGSDRETIGSDGETDNFLGKLGFDITRHHRIEASYDLLQDEGDYTPRPDMGVVTNDAISGNILMPTEYERETINVSYEMDYGDIIRLDATYYTNDLTLYRDERNAAVPGSTLTDREVTSDNYGINLLAESKVDTGPVGHTLKYGFEYFDQSLSYVSNVSGGAQAQDQESNTLGIFFENEMNFFDRLILRPGVRYNEHEVEFLETNSSGSWDEVTFGVATEIPVTEGFRLLASYTELFRGPELAEPFTGSGATKVANPDVEPETGHNIEAGFRLTHHVENVTFRVGANYFIQEIDNFIAEDAVPSMPANDWDINIGTARFEGVEASLNAIYQNWDFLLTYAKSDLDASDLTVTGTTESIREIGDMVGYDIGYIWPKYNVTFGLNGQFIQDKQTETEGLKEGYSVHNLMARWDDAANVRGLSITFGIDNLLDKTYTSHASRLGNTVHPVFGALNLNDVEPGRNIKFTLAKVF